MKGFAARAALLTFALCVGACSTIRHDFVKQESHALPPADDTKSAQYIAAELQHHVGESGFRLLTKSNDALIQDAYVLILNRPPSDEEQREAAVFLNSLTNSSDRRAAAATFCQTLFASAEFRFLY